jgi:hypothetical protein
MAGATVSQIPAHRWPWHWTYAIVLEKKWEQIQELGSWDDNGEPPPKEWWHDHKYIEDWVEEKRNERKAKYEK